MIRDNAALTVTLELAVPLRIAEVIDLPFAERRRIAEEAGTVVAAQGDTLQYGSSDKFGAGAKERRRHEAHGNARAAECEDCHRTQNQPRCCMRRFSGKCRVCLTGQPSYSAGEVFNFLARGLAVAACQPGGVTFAGLHWCAYPHPCCPDRFRSGRRPGCCTCTGACLLVTSCSSPPEGSECTGGCPFCENGCAAAGTGQACCTARHVSVTPKAVSVP
jgi:hypothetical protein